MNSSVSEQNPMWLQVFTPPGGLALHLTLSPKARKLLPAALPPPALPSPTHTTLGECCVVFTEKPLVAEAIYWTSNNRCLSYTVAKSLQYLSHWVTEFVVVLLCVAFRCLPPDVCCNRIIMTKYVICKGFAKPQSQQVWLLSYTSNTGSEQIQG